MSHILELKESHHVFKYKDNTYLRVENSKMEVYWVQLMSDGIYSSLRYGISKYMQHKLEDMFKERAANENG